MHKEKKKNMIKQKKMRKLLANNFANC